MKLSILCRGNRGASPAIAKFVSIFYCVYFGCFSAWRRVVQPPSAGQNAFLGPLVLAGCSRAIVLNTYLLPFPAPVNLLIVEIENLTKIYDSKLRVVAVDGINLELKQGEIFGLLGPNGAGKTTTISIATTSTLPTSGTVRIAGIDVVQHPAHARRLIGVVPQFNTLDRSLTVYENIYFHCRYFRFSDRKS